MTEVDLLNFLKENIEYVDGHLVCKKRWHNKLQVGQKLGKIRGGYVVISVLGKRYKAHRLIFLLCNGTLPPIIDHIDRDKLNNNIENLRPASKSENERNREKYSTNTSGYKGVWFHKQRNKWVAEITINGKANKLGLFDTPEAAALAYNNASTLLHGKCGVLNTVP